MLKENLQKLSEAIGVSGGEKEIRQLIRELVGEKLAELTTDPMGNLSGVLRGTGAVPGFRVMVAAHMDETGFMVSNVGENGMISVLPVGPLDMRYLITARVHVGEKKQNGVLLWPPIHKSNGQNAVPGVETVQIDVGADGKGGVSASPGDRVGLIGAYAEMGAGLVRGKAFNGRAGCAALIGLIDALIAAPLPYDVHFAFTAQEMIGARGARVAAHRIDPQAAFVLRGTEANDLPRPDNDDSVAVIRLGGGPAITINDPTFMADRRLVAHLREVAESDNVPYQIDARENGVIGGGLVSFARAGVPVGVIGLPVRYMSSPNGLLNLSDLENTIRLLHGALAALRPETLEN